MQWSITNDVNGQLSRPAPVGLRLSLLTRRIGLSGVRLRTKGGGEIYLIPEPRRDLAKFFSLADVVPPTLLPAGRTNADTERKLTSRCK